VNREALATGMAGGVLGGAALAPLGLTVPGAIVGGLNGLISGGRRIYDWRRPAGWGAFVLDSTWGLIGTAAALGVHGLQQVRRDRGTFRPDLSRRRNRHVYDTGVTARRRFAMTVGNTVTNLAGRVDLLERHEMVHVWQGRFFGPVFPLVYGTWMVGGTLAGFAVWLRHRDGLRQTVDTFAYYDNPFEYWAYRRQGYWPPATAHSRYAWSSNSNEVPV
jgi:hypothetical protein